MAEVEEAVSAAGAASASPGHRRRAPRRNLGHLPKDLERIEHVIEPDSTQCPCGCGDMIRIGEDRTERLDIVPAQLRVIVTVRPKYACRTCEQGVIQAAAPAHLIIGGLPTEGALAQVLISKYGDHLPLYRQSQIYARSGVELDRSTLAGWVGKASFHLTPVVDRLAWHLKQSDHLFMDEDPGAGAGPGPGQDQDGVPVGAGPRSADPGPVRIRPAWCSSTRPAAAAATPRAFLEGFKGKLHVDGYAGYNVVAVPGKGVVRLFLLEPRQAQAVRDPRQPPLHDRRRRVAAGLRPCTPSRRRSGASPPRSGSPCVRRAPRRWSRTSGRGCAGNAPGYRRSRVWARSWPISATTGNGLQVFLTDGRVEMDTKYRGKCHPAAGAQSQECAVRRP